MSKGFNLTAELNLRGPSNIRAVIADIRRQVDSVSININPTVNRQSIRNVANTIKGQLANLVCDVKVRANASSLRSIGTDIRRQLGGITANVNVRANSSSVRSAAADIRRQLGSINASVNVTFNTSTVTAYSGRLVALNNNLNQITASATNATGAINALAAAMRSAATASSAINNTAVNLRNIGGAANNTRNSVALATNEMVEFGRQSGLAFRRFSAITTVTSVIYGLTNAISQGVKAFIDFDLQLTRVSQVTGDSKNKLADVANTITNLSTSLGVSSSELTTTTVTLAQAGLTAQETATALKALALSALAPSFDDMNQTVEGSIALMRQFGIGANQLEMALGSVNAVSAKFAVEASDIITAIQRTGGVFASASKGVSSGTDALNEFIAVFTSIRATTRESAETIATGLRTIFTRIQRAGTIEALQEFGVTLTDLEGKFVGPYIAVQRLSEGLSRLDPRDLKFSQIIEELGGFRQIGKVLPLIQQFATAQDALKVAQQGQGSLAADAAKGQLALAVQIQKVREEFLALIRSVGDTSSFQNIVRVGLDLASALIKVADATKGVLPLLTLFAAFKGITAATQYIGGFSQGIRGTGGGTRRANEGGRVYAFASGGLVPGYGNGDIVSAKLTPGEFVMSKPAVQSIGVGRLSSLNRNSGGIIPSSSDIQRFEKGSLVNKKARKESKKPIKNEFGFTEIIKTPSTSTQASHITELLPLDPRQIKQAILATKDRKLSFSIEQALGTSPKEINKKKPFKSIHSLIEKSTDSEIKWLSQQIGLDAQRDIKINLPSNYNQALRRGDPRLIAKSDMIQWISKNNTVLNPLPKKIKSIINKNWIASSISGINPKNPPSKTFNTLAYDEDSELTSLGRNFQRIYETNGVSNAVILKFKGASKDFYRKLGGYGSGTGGRGDRTSISAESIGMNIGGLIQKFGIGGGVKPVTRTVGVIDSDDWKEDPVVAAQMKTMGIAKLDEYKVYMSNLVAEKRKSGGIRRLRTVFGAAASGKTSIAYGGARSQEVDNARLRKTTRRAIRVPSDLEGLDEVIDTTSVLGPRNASSLRASDRIRNLSSRSKAGQEAVMSRRKNRDRLSESGVPDPSGRNYGLFNRRPGATDGAPVDTGIDEAWLAASEVSGVDRKKVTTTDVATGRRIGAPKVRTPEKTTVFSGNVGPMTSGHVEAIMKGSKKAKTGPEDTVIYVAGNTPIDPFTRDDQRERTAIFPQMSSSGPSRVGMAQAVLGSKGFNVSAAPKGIAPGAFPKAFKIEGQEDSYIVPKSTGNAAIIGNDKPDTTIERNRAQGYEPIKIARNGISGTDARAAIMSNDLEAMQKNLTPEGIEYLNRTDTDGMTYLSKIQKRPKLLDSILARIQENAQKGKGRAGRYSSAVSELSTLPARVTAKTPSDVANRVKDLRAQRDIDEAVLGRRAGRMLPKLERLRRSSGGDIQNFMAGGVATEPDITTSTKASAGEIIKLLGLDKAAAAGGISALDVYTTLNKRTPTPQQAASKAAILAEFTKQKTSLASKAAASQTRKQNKATAKGLVFGAAGLFGSAFATQPVVQTIQDSRLKDPNKQHTVSIYSGVYKNQKRASSIDASFDKAVDTIPMQQAQKEKRAEMTAQKKRVRSVLGGFESGRELNLDFDRTLAFGADKILADPKQPRFSEFSDTTKVTEALGKAKLSVLGRQLASLVSKKPELLKNIRVITARPKATLPLIQTWLSSKGLPIEAGQFKGLGGPTISGSDIARLKAAELTPGSIFIDDDKRNTSVARKRADEGIDVYRYRGVKKLKENTQSLENIESLKGNLLEAFIRRLGAVGSPKGNGFDFMNGLGKVSQKFDPKLPPKIPTDVKRTLAGPSTIKDNIVTYLKNVKGYNDGGTVQNFMAGGVANKAKKPKEVFGTGDTVFPSSISKAYTKEQQTAEENARAKLAWDKYPKDERIMVDDEKVKTASQQPFDKARFTASFKEKISRDTLFDRMSDFAKLVGLPQEDLSVALPLQLDFGASKRGGGLGMFAAAQFEKGATGIRPYEGYDLSKFGYGEKQKQEVYGLKKLITTKEKEIAKIVKTPVRTYDDGSFSFDREAYSKANVELDALKNKSFVLSNLKSNAEKTALAEQNDVSSAAGRGTISFASSMGYSSDTRNSTLYHEMTHQLFQGLRTRSAESFNKYRTKVASLFSGDNNDLADAFDSLTEGGGYSSADVVYGRSYKSNNLSQILSSYYRQNLDFSRSTTTIPQDTTKNLASLSNQSTTAKRAREYRPINPKVNQALLQAGDKFGMTQEKIDRMEDNGKEEFLTTLIERAPQLDQNLQGILDSTLTELLSGAGIKRQKFAVGGVAEAGKKEDKQYGQISITEDAGMISIGYQKGNNRQGYATGYKMRDNLYYVGLSKATKGYGPRLYDVLMEAVTEKGAMLTSDRSSVSEDAKRVWEYYFKNRGDVKKTPLKPSDWTVNSELIDPKLYGKKETWPPATDPAWTLQTGYSKSPRLITDTNEVIRKRFGGSLGFETGGTVPALVSNGEAYVPPKVAKRIGYGTLNRMNQADRNGMESFSRGGISVFRGPGSGTSDSIGPIGLPVGGFVIRAAATKALGLSRGGAVQRFAFGGGPRAVPDISGMSDARALSVVGVTDNVTSQLENLATVLQELGVRSGDSARIIQSGTQATYQQAIRATEADIRRARLAGASAEQIAQAENKLAAIRRQAQQDITTRRTLGGLSGQALQSIETNAQEERDRIRTNTRNRLAARGMSQEDIDTRLERNAGAIDRQAYTRASNRAGVNLRANGLTGDDAQRYIGQAMRDPRILKQMDEQYTAARRRSISIEIQATGDRQRAARVLAGLDKETERAIREDINARKTAVQEAAKANKARGPKDNEERSNLGYVLAGATITVGNMIADSIDVKQSASSAAMSSGIRSGTYGLGITTAVSGELGNLAAQFKDSSTALGKVTAASLRMAQGLAYAGGTAISLVAATKDAVNAYKQFYIDLAQNRISGSMQRVEMEFERLARTIDLIDFTSIQDELVRAADNFSSMITSMKNKGLIQWVNIFDALQAYLPNSITGSMDMSQFKDLALILEKGGFEAYSRAKVGGPDSVRDEMSNIIPDIAREQAAIAKPISDAIVKTLGERFRRGETSSDVVSGPDFGSIANTLANADVAIRETILRLENSGLDNATIEERKKLLIESAAEEKVMQEEMIAIREKEGNAIARFGQVYTRSLSRTFENMNQVTNSLIFTLDKFKDSTEASTKALSGQAQISQVKLETGNIINNPRAYSDAKQSVARTNAASLFGSRSDIVTPLLQSAESAQASIMSTVNRTLESNPGATNELILRNISTNLKSTFKDIGLPPELSEKMAKEVGKAVAELRQKGDNEISFSDLQDKITGLAGVLDITKEAASAANKALEAYSSILNNYINYNNQLIEIEVSSREKLNKSIDIIVDSNSQLSRTLGNTIDLENSRNKLLAKTGRVSGGAEQPDDLFKAIIGLNQQRSVEQGSADTAAERKFNGNDDFIKFNSQLKTSSVALRENYSALKLLAENTEYAADAMGRIQEIQNRIGGRISFIEKVVTSSPQEVESLNNALTRLQNNINSQLNTINNSTGAQQAYTEAIRNGATAAEAMKAAQNAFANERKETLGTLQDILPFLGEGREAGGIKANVLESMLKESGIGVNPLFAQVLNSLRNPETDPALATAIQHYQEANNLQSEANKLLGQLDSELAKDIANQQSKALLEGMKNLVFKFENQELKDIKEKINTLVPIAAPQAKSSGGVIYAAAGQMIDFKTQGTDTVPAMLTPGEFVVNRAATAANRPLLESINSRKYAQGGKVSYYADGGYVSNFGNSQLMSEGDIFSNIEVLDLADLSVANELKRAFGIYQKLPSVYTMINSNKQAPKANENGLDLTDLRTDMATVVPGVSSAFKIGRVAGESIIQSVSTADLFPFLNEEPFKQKNEFFYGDSDLGKLKTTKIRKNNYDKWKEAAGKIPQNVLQTLKPQKIVDGDDFGEIPELSELNDNINTDYASPNIVGKSYGIYSQGAVPKINTINGYSLYKNVNNNKTAVSQREPHFESDTEYGSSVANWTLSGRPPIGMDGNISSDKIISGSTLSDAININNGDDGAYSRYAKSVDLYNDPNNFFKESNPPKDFIDVQQKLKNLYAGKIYEEFSGDLISKYFDLFTRRTNLSAGDANPFWVFGDNPVGRKELEDIASHLATLPKAKTNNIRIGNIKNPPGQIPNPVDFVQNNPFTIEGFGNLAAQNPVKNFPWATNLSLDLFSRDFQDQIIKGVNLGNPGNIKQTLKNEKAQLKIPLPLGIPDVDVPVDYSFYDWSGKLFDSKSEEFVDPEQTAILPHPIKDTVFENLDISKFRVIDNPKNNWFTQPQIKLNNQTLDPYVTALYNDKKDPNLPNLRKAADNSVQVEFAEARTANPVTFAGVDVLEKTLFQQPKPANITDYILKQIDLFLETKGTEAGKADIGFKGLRAAAVDDNELPDVVRNLSKSSLGLFARKPIPGFARTWLGNYIGKIPLMKNMNSDFAKRAAQYASGIFTQAGGTVDGLISSGNFIPSKIDYLKSVWTLLSGASSIFGGLASGNTRFTEQLRDAGSSPETLFTSAGAGVSIGKIMGSKLNQDWQNVLDTALKDGKIKTVGAGGKLSEINMEDKVPDNVKDLTSLIFNPYNEFAEQNTRTTLINKFITDLGNFRGNNPLVGPFRGPGANTLIDPSTLKFIQDRTTILEKWYSGDMQMPGAGWVGQDYLYDKVKQPDNTVRTKEFMDSYKNSGEDLYDEANKAHIELGLGESFGPLPTDNYFNARIARGFQTGGVVYAEGGGDIVNFQPRGTDTVPAMLTAGEFVVNRAATQQNLPLLKAINNGSRSASVSNYRKEGGVIYAANGGWLGNWADWTMGPEWNNPEMKSNSFWGPFPEELKILAAILKASIYTGSMLLGGVTGGAAGTLAGGLGGPMGASTGAALGYALADWLLGYKKTQQSKSKRTNDDDALLPLLPNSRNGKFSTDDLRPNDNFRRNDRPGRSIESGGNGSKGRGKQGNTEPRPPQGGVSAAEKARMDAEKQQQEERIKKNREALDRVLEEPSRQVIPVAPPLSAPSMSIVTGRSLETEKPKTTTPIVPQPSSVPQTPRLIEGKELGPVTGAPHNGILSKKITPLPKVKPETKKQKPSRKFNTGGFVSPMYLEKGGSAFERLGNAVQGLPQEEAVRKEQTRVFNETMNDVRGGESELNRLLMGASKDTQHLLKGTMFESDDIIGLYNSVKKLRTNKDVSPDTISYMYAKIKNANELLSSLSKAREDMEIVAGNDKIYGTMDDKNGLLDQLSLSLTAASVVTPVIPDLLSIPIDLLRGDLTGAGMSLSSAGLDIAGGYGGTGIASTKAAMLASSGIGVASVAGKSGMKKFIYEADDLFTNKTIRDTIYAPDQDVAIKMVEAALGKGYMLMRIQEKINVVDAAKNILSRGSNFFGKKTTGTPANWSAGQIGTSGNSSTTVNSQFLPRLVTWGGAGIAGLLSLIGIPLGLKYAINQSGKPFANTVSGESVDVEAMRQKPANARPLMSPEEAKKKREESEETQRNAAPNLEERKARQQEKDAQERAKKGISEDWHKQRDKKIKSSADNDGNNIPDVYEWAVAELRKIYDSTPKDKTSSLRHPNNDSGTFDGYIDNFYPLKKATGRGGEAPNGWENEKVGKLIKEIESNQNTRSYYNRGGVVYASQGTLVNFQPRGTDTVPAMLTPGEFVVNARATRANLPLLQSINKNKGGVVYAAEGGKIDVRDKSQIDYQMVSLVNSLLPYTSGTEGREKLSSFGRDGMDINSITVEKPDYNDSIIASYLTEDLSKTTNKKGKIKFAERLTGAPTVRHEMAHAIANDKHDGLLAPFINESLIDELGKSKYKELGDTGYEVEDLAKKPAEMFAVLASIGGSLGGASKLFLKNSMRALGYDKGGVVYAADGGTIPTKPDGSADTNFDARKAQRTAYLQRQIEKEEKSEFIDKLGILYNDTTDKQDIIEALKQQKNYKTKIDYYLRQFSTDNQFGLRLKRYPRISEAGKSILAKQEQPKANPFDMGQQPAATPQSLSGGGVIYASEGTLVNYQPRGTDTVPAMLTPGEFVVNAKATQANLPLLHAINSGAMSEGGVVYASRGLRVPLTPEEKTNKQNKNAIIAAKAARAMVREKYFKTAKQIQQLQESNGEPQEINELHNLLIDLQDKWHEIDHRVSILGDTLGYSKHQSLQEKKTDILYRGFGLRREPEGISDILETSSPEGQRDYYNGMAGLNEYSRKSEMQQDRDTAKERNQSLNEYYKTNPEAVDNARNSGYMGNLEDFRNATTITGARGQEVSLSDKQIAHREKIAKRMKSNRKDMESLSRIRKDRLSSEQPEQMSSGGVVYARNGMVIPKITGNANYDDMQKTKADQYNKNKSDSINRGSSQNSSSMALFTEVLKQVTTNSKSFESFDPSAIIEDMSPEDIEKQYEKNWAGIDPDKVYAAAKKKYFEDTRRIKYLQEIFNNSMMGLAIINKTPAIGNKTIQNVPLREILTKQLLARTEASNIDQAWRRLYEKHPEFRAENAAAQEASGHNTGGIVYASQGMMIPYVPRGTDTVPAMLTPGEFVVNRAATQQNLPLLREINNNRYANGGRVKYLEYGGMSDQSGGGGGGGVSSSSGSSTPNMDGLSQFTIKFGQFIAALQQINLPPVINIEGNHKVEVTINGAAAFQAMDEGVRRIVLGEVNKAMSSIGKQTDYAVA